MLWLVYAGWRFSFSGVIVNNISCLGVNDLKSSDLGQLLFIPVGLGVGFEIFSLCNFWICQFRPFGLLWFVFLTRFGLFTAFLWRV